MNVAMCIPTYNRAEVVEDTLNKGIEGYYKKGIDLYYYDSSESNLTEVVVKKYIDMGYDNIHYIRCENGDNKFAMYFSGVGQEKEYDYIWPVKDRVWFEEPTLNAIEQAMSEEYDAIFLGVLWCFAHPNIGTKTYDNPVDFYLDWGYLVTSMDVSVFNRKTMLDKLCEEEIKTYISEFTHFHIMFHQLCEGNKKVRALVGNEIIANNSKLVGSSWKKQVFSIWKDKWIKVNEDLPQCYDEHKNTVIKYAGMLPWIFGTIDILLEYKNCGAFDEEELPHILKDWSRVSDIPVEKVRAIAEGTYNKRHDIDLLPKTSDELTNLIVQMACYLKIGTMTRDRIPYDDIFQGIMNKVLKRYKENNAIINIVAGSIEDVLIYIRDGAKTKEDIDKAIQILISIVILAN